MKCWFVLIAIHIVGFATAQQEVLSKIPASGNSYQLFIPKDYDTIQTATGDLNKDSVADFVMVLKSKQEDKEGVSDELPQRLLIVLFKQANGYKLAAKCDSAILCKGCGGVFGDPFQEINIARGVLNILHYGGSSWRWELTHKFRFQQDQFYLIGKTSYSYWNVKHCDKLDDFAGASFEDVNLVTGSFVKKRISEECKLLENKKGKKKAEPLKKLIAFNIDTQL